MNMICDEHLLIYTLGIRICKDNYKDLRLNISLINYNL